MDLIVLTPDSTVFEGTVSRVVFPGEGGDFEVLTNHAPLISALGNGKVQITTNDNQQKTFNIEGGFVEVLDNKLSLVAERVVD